MELKIEINLPKLDLDRRRILGEMAEAYIKEVKDRVIKRNQGLRGAPLKAYSTRPLRLSKAPKSQCGKRMMRPRGGIPSKTGKTVFYPHGHAQYKQDTLGTTEVNYINSGEFWGNFRIKLLNVKRAETGWSGKNQLVAVELQKRGTFIGQPNRRERAVIERAMRREIDRQMKKA